MECFNHPGSSAAGTCQQCGKALCVECLKRFEPPMCEPCFIKNNDGVTRRLYCGLAVTAIIFIAVTVFCFQASPNKSGGVFTGFVAACAYWGWQFLGRFSVPVLFTSGFGLITYFIFKAVLAMLIGIIAMPVQIFKAVRDIRLMNQYKALLAQEKAQQA